MESSTGFSYCTVDKNKLRGMIFLVEVIKLTDFLSLFDILNITGKFGHTQKCRMMYSVDIPDIVWMADKNKIYMPLRIL